MYTDVWAHSVITVSSGLISAYCNTPTITHSINHLEWKQRAHDSQHTCTSTPPLTTPLTAQTQHYILYVVLEYTC